MARAKSVSVTVPQWLHAVLTSKFYLWFATAYGATIIFMPGIMFQMGSNGDADWTIDAAIIFIAVLSAVQQRVLIAVTLAFRRQQENKVAEKGTEDERQIKGVRTL